MSVLKNIHENKYSTVQLNAWAHMIQLKKHSSHDSPPELPYFGKRKRSEHKEKSLQGCSISPCKHVKLRSECIDQLNKWRSLLEKGGISKVQYDKLQETVLADMLEDH